MDKVATIIGENIRNIRKLNGFSTEALAEKIDIDTAYLGQCERGERRLGLDKMLELTKVLNITPNDILPVHKNEQNPNIDREEVLYKITKYFEDCSDNQLLMLSDLICKVIPYLKS